MRCRDLACLASTKRGASLEEHQGRFFEEVFDLFEVLGTKRAIDDAVIAGKAEVHAEAWNDLAVFDDGFFDCGTDGEDGCLGWVDDGVEGFDAPSAEIGDGDGAAIELVGFEFLVFGTNCEILDGARDV